MEEEINNAQGGPAYPVTDAEKAFLQAAYVGTSWKHDVQQSPEVMAAAAALAEQHPLPPETTEAPKLTKNDIDAVCSAIASECSTAGMSPDAIAKLIAAIHGAAKNAKSASELMSEAQQMASAELATTKGDIVQAVMYNEAQFNAAVARFDDLEKKAQTEFDRLPTTEDERKRHEARVREYEEAKASGDHTRIATAARALGQDNVNVGTAHGNSTLVQIGHSQGKEADTLLRAADNDLQPPKVTEQRHSTRDMFANEPLQTRTPIQLATAEASNANLPRIQVAPGQVDPSLGRA